MSSSTFLRLQCGNGRHFGSVLLFPLDTYNYNDFFTEVNTFFKSYFFNKRARIGTNVCSARGQKRKGLFNPFQNFDDVVHIVGNAFPFNSVWFFIIE